MNPRRLLQLASESYDLAMALPHRIDLITQRMAANQFETRLTVPELSHLMVAMQKVANRIFCGLVLAGLLVASAMLLPLRRILGTLGFVLAGVIGLWMVLSIAWNDRR